MPTVKPKNQQLGVVLVITSLPDDESSYALARSVVGEGLAACAQCLPGVTSIYRWRGKIETANEVVVQFKTQVELVDRVVQLIQDEHPYELPEVITVPVSGGLPGYLDWVKDETQHSLSDKQNSIKR